MLPRPLCEVACSLNEGVERLALSVVWVMNMDGTLASRDIAKDDSKNFIFSLDQSMRDTDYSYAY